MRKKFEYETYGNIVYLETDYESGHPIVIALPTLDANFVIYPGFIVKSNNNDSIKITFLTFAEEILKNSTQIPLYQQRNYVQAVQQEGIFATPNFNQFECCLEEQCVQTSNRFSEFYTAHICQFRFSTDKRALVVRFRNTNPNVNDTHLINIKREIPVVQEIKETFTLTVSTIHECKTIDRRNTMVNEVVEWIFYHQELGIDRLLIYFRSVTDLIQVRDAVDMISLKKRITLVHFPGFNETMINRAFGYYDQYIMTMQMLVTHLQKDTFAYVGNDWDEFLVPSPTVNRYRSIAAYLNDRNIVHKRLQNLYRLSLPGQQSNSQCETMLLPRISTKIYFVERNKLSHKKPLIKVKDTQCVDVHFACLEENQTPVELYTLHLRDKEWNLRHDDVVIKDLYQQHLVKKIIDQICDGKEECCKNYYDSITKKNV